MVHIQTMVLIRLHARWGVELTAVIYNETMLVAIDRVRSVRAGSVVLLKNRNSVRSEDAIIVMDGDEEVQVNSTYFEIFKP